MRSAAVPTSPGLIAGPARRQDLDRARDRRGYTVRTIFGDTDSIIPGEDVKIDGVKVRTVGSDAKLQARPQTLIGKKYVDYLPTQPHVKGTPSPPALKKIPSGKEGRSRACPELLHRNSQIPPFLLPIFQAAGTAYGIPQQVLETINEIETDYGRDLSVSSAGAEGWMQFPASGVGPSWDQLQRRQLQGPLQPSRRDLHRRAATVDTLARLTVPLQSRPM